MGTPTGRETYGVGPPVVLRVQDSCIHGEGATLQRGPELVVGYRQAGEVSRSGLRQGGMRNAKRRGVPEPSFRARQERLTCRTGLQAIIQPKSLSRFLRQAEVTSSSYWTNNRKEFTP